VLPLHHGVLAIFDLRLRILDLTAETQLSRKVKIAIWNFGTSASGGTNQTPAGLSVGFTGVAAVHCGGCRTMAIESIAFTRPAYITADTQPGFTFPREYLTLCSIERTRLTISSGATGFRRKPASPALINRSNRSC
jgi:hypothetical protein